MKSARQAELSKHVRARRADATDAAVGQKIRSRRLECRLSQTELADRIGVTFQQVQKYEKGVNRVGAGRLMRICEALGVQSAFFLGERTASNEAQTVLSQLAQDRGAISILEVYKDLPRHQRHALVVISAALAAA